MGMLLKALQSNTVERALFRQSLRAPHSHSLLLLKRTTFNTTFQAARAAAAAVVLGLR